MKASKMSVEEVIQRYGYALIRVLEGAPLKSAQKETGLAVHSINTCIRMLAYRLTPNCYERYRATLPSRTLDFFRNCEALITLLRAECKLAPPTVVGGVTALHRLTPMQVRKYLSKGTRHFFSTSYKRVVTLVGFDIDNRTRGYCYVWDEAGTRPGSLGSVNLAELNLIEKWENK